MTYLTDFAFLPLVLPPVGIVCFARMQRQRRRGLDVSKLDWSHIRI